MRVQCRKLLRHTAHYDVTEGCNSLAIDMERRRVVTGPTNLLLTTTVRAATDTQCQDRGKRRDLADAAT